MTRTIFIRHLQTFLWGLLLINLLETIYALFTSGQVLTDDIEHLHSAFLVYSGYVPYIDFFEHHHPLLWYMLAPIIGSLPHHTAIALYIGRIISFAVSLAGGWYVYRICRKFLGGKTIALIALNLYFWAVILSAPALYNVKPDIYMRCCFFCGLYYLFCYFRYCRFRDLQISTLAFGTAFLFLQSSILQMFPVFIVALWYIWQHPKQIPDFLCAAIIPCLIFGLLFWLLVATQTWNRYFELNWLYNAHLTELLHAYPFTWRIVFYADLLLASLVSIFYLRKYRHLNFYASAIALILIFEVLQRLFWVSTYFHYYAMMVICAAMLSAPLIYQLVRKHYIWRWCIAGWCGFHLLINPFIKHPELQSLNQYDATKYCYTLLCGVYTQPAAYYWTYPSHEALDDIFFAPVKDYDINKLLDDSEVLQFRRQSDLDEIFKRVEDTFSLDKNSQHILNRHKIMPERLQNYREIAPNLYQRQ